ncbi:hypothetical protein PHAVU_008G171000 [Phaseolus vulgaris]|uniref:Uncharacterized protein n=1 Tax=Phaseolus vulgaris TaxID=3885 RepID=V7B9L5_PHAVU|nr:hypothetical protein PHAVU_008G171000g [Phaseolus vulgaris]ESW13136.1 hypothetical protein PHAVU_008G171000g [Phaseolus vulgaris]
MSNRNEIKTADKLDFTKIKLPFACDTYAPGSHPSVASPHPQFCFNSFSTQSKGIADKSKTNPFPVSIAIHIIVTVGWI